MSSKSGVAVAQSFCTISVRTVLGRTALQKAIVGAALVRTCSLTGADDMRLGIAEAVAACYSDINETGVSPLQAVAGRQQPAQGDVLAGVGNRLAHSSSRTSLAYLAKLPYVKRHELPWCACIFPEVCVEVSWPEQDPLLCLTFPSPVTFAIFCNPRGKGTGATSRRKLDLRRWFGPFWACNTCGHREWQG